MSLLFFTVFALLLLARINCSLAFIGTSGRWLSQPLSAVVSCKRNMRTKTNLQFVNSNVTETTMESSIVTVTIPPRPPMSPRRDPLEVIENDMIITTNSVPISSSSHHANDYYRHEDNTAVIIGNDEMIASISKKNTTSVSISSSSSSHDKSPILMERLKNIEDFGGISILLEKTLGKKVKQRLWTKADFAHIHAISGGIYLFAGIPWTIYTTARHFSEGGAEAAMSENLSSVFLMFLIIQGAVNAISAIPMARFSSDKIFDLSDLKGLGFSMGGTGLTLMCLWASVWFAGDAYPDWLHGLPDLGFFALWSFICIATTYNWETMLQQDMEGKEKDKKMTKAEANASGNRKFATTKKNDEELDDFEKSFLYRLASWPNLSQLLFLASPCFGGTAWLSRVTEIYPLQATLCYHYAFASALGYSLSMFSETLRDRKLVTLRQDLVVLMIGTVYPMILVGVDAIAFGDKVTINPLDYWYIFSN